MAANNTTWYDKHECERCGVKTSALTMSFFNTDALCLACKNDEKGAPNYKAAHDAEVAECLRGNLNFPGIGLSNEDYLYLAERRRERLEK